MVVSEAARRALGAIDGVHRVPRSTADVSIVLGYLPGASGYYDPASRRIAIDPTAPDPAFTVLHELAHHLDMSSLGDRLTPGSLSPALNMWRDAVQASAAFDTLTRRFWTPLVISGVTFPARADRLMYYLELEELFARSYAQHIATTSNDPILMNELNMSPRLAPAVDVLYPVQWDSLDFTPISTAFDQLFEVLQWSR